MQSSFNPLKDLISWIKYLPGFVLAFLSIVLRFKALQQTKFANGWDGYFYLVQIKSWVEEGSMHSADLSLIYPLIRFVNWFTGDYILAFKMTAALLAGLTTFGFYHLTKRWSGSMYLAILVGSISLFSPHLTYFAAQFPKNLLGFVFLLFFIGSLSMRTKSASKLLKAKPITLTTFYPFIWLILCFFGHRLTFGIAMIFGLAWIAFNYFTLKKVAIFIGTVVVIFVLSLIIPGLPNLSDFQRFDGLLSSSFQFSPYSFTQTFGTADRISTFWLAEIIVASALYFLSIPFLLKAKNRWLAFTLFGVSTLLLFPFYTWDLTGMAYRFFLLYILMAPLFIALFIKIEYSQKSKITLLFFAIVFMLGSIFSLRSYQPEKHDANYKKYAQLTEKTLEHLNSENTELLIAHNALAEYFTFTTGIDAMPWNPEYEIEQNKLWRIATDIRQSEIAYYLNESEMKEVHKISIRYFLLPDHLWQKVLTQAEVKGDGFLIEKLNTWRNPHRIRPGFLLKKK